MSRTFWEFYSIWVLIACVASIASARPGADVYEPKSPAVATIIYVHCGAWLGGDKSEAAKTASTLTTQGFRFVAINYRLSQKARHPAPIDDLDRELNATKGDVFLVGHSAGAHMIAYWNTVHENARVKGLVGIEGIYDIPKLLITWPTYRDWFIAKEFGTDAAKYAEASPSLLRAKSKTPWLIIHSAKDELVDLEQSKGFAAKLNAQKIPAELFVLKAETHFGAVTSLADPKSATAQEVLRFIKIPKR